jgi:Reverse transcriptase (RNA-dependent DNA polymerase)
MIHKTNIATELAIKEKSKKIEKMDKKLVSEEYHEYLNPKSFKNYNLTPAEQNKLDKFLQENLKKGYIRPLQSPMASPFFFVSKKDGKLQPCQDYWYLNDWTIKNSYPLPLISEIMDKLKGAKYFTKLDIH